MINCNFKTECNATFKYSINSATFVYVTVFLTWNLSILNPTSQNFLTTKMPTICHLTPLTVPGTLLKMQPQYSQSEAHDLEVCNLQLFFLEKRRDLRTLTLCPNMDKNKIEAARAEKCARNLTPNKEIFKPKNTQL